MALVRRDLDGSTMRSHDEFERTVGLPGGAGGDPATSYRVYLSRDGRAFDSGHDVTGFTWNSNEAGVAVGDSPLFARMTAINAGGESLPSPVVGGRVAPTGSAQVLIVNGFTRLDGFMLIDEDLSAYALGNIERDTIEIQQWFGKDVIRYFRGYDS